MAIKVPPSNIPFSTLTFLPQTPPPLPSQTNQHLLLENLSYIRQLSCRKTPLSFFLLGCRAKSNQGGTGHSEKGRDGNLGHVVYDVPHRGISVVYVRREKTVSLSDRKRSITQYGGHFA
jgi:hypothetical protein